MKAVHWSRWRMPYLLKKILKEGHIFARFALTARTFRPPYMWAIADTLASSAFSLNGHDDRRHPSRSSCTSVQVGHISHRSSSCSDALLIIFFKSRITFIDLFETDSELTWIESKAFADSSLKVGLPTIGIKAHDRRLQDRYRYISWQSMKVEERRQEHRINGDLEIENMIWLLKIQSQVQSIARDLSQNHDWRKSQISRKQSRRLERLILYIFWISDALNNSPKSFVPVHRKWLRSAPKCFHNYLWGFWRFFNYSESSVRLKLKGLSIWELFNSATLQFRNDAFNWIETSIICRKSVSIIESPALTHREMLPEASVLYHSA
jgi:hypothetical protein